MTVKSIKFFVRWRKYLQTNWNLFRAFICTQVVQKYRPSSMRFIIWTTVNIDAGCKIPVESWAHRFFLLCTYFETSITKVDIAHVPFPDVKRNNHWHEKKALRNGITWNPLPLLITLHNNIHYPPFPLGALRSGWMIPNAWAKMKQQKSFNSSQNFIKNDFEIEKSCHKLQK